MKTAARWVSGRSRLFSLALGNYLRQRRNREILERLNKVYAGDPSPEERRTIAGMKRRFRSTIRENW